MNHHLVCLDSPGWVHCDLQNGKKGWNARPITGLLSRHMQQPPASTSFFVISKHSKTCSYLKKTNDNKRILSTSIKSLFHPASCSEFTSHKIISSRISLRYSMNIRMSCGCRGSCRVLAVNSFKEWVVTGQRLNDAMAGCPFQHPWWRHGWECVDIWIAQRWVYSLAASRYCASYVQLTKPPNLGRGRLVVCLSKRIYENHWFLVKQQHLKKYKADVVLPLRPSGCNMSK